MNELKRFFKRNSHNLIFKVLAGFGRALNRLYENRNHDIYSNGELVVIKKLAKFSPSVIIDGGANIGDYSLIFNQMIPGCKIFAFEPVKSTYNELKVRIKEHKNIEPIEKGLYSDNCTKEINLFDLRTHSSHSTLYDIKNSFRPIDKCFIDLVRGDDFMEEKGIDKIDYLKLDIEGAEYDAILGFEKHFRAKKIKAVQFEFGYINISTKKLLIDFYTLFEDYGYTVGKIFPKYVEFRDYDFKYEDFIGPNYIAVDKNETKLIDSLRKK